MDAGHGGLSSVRQIVRPKAPNRGVSAGRRIRSRPVSGCFARADENPAFTISDDASTPDIRTARSVIRDH